MSVQYDWIYIRFMDSSTSILANQLIVTHKSGTKRQWTVWSFLYLYMTQITNWSDHWPTTLSLTGK